MTDRELLQQALDTLRHLCLHSRAVKGYDGEQVQAGIDALKARLAQPESEPDCKTGSSCTNKCEQCIVREWVDLTATEIKLLRRAATSDRRFAELIQAKLKDKNK